MRRLEGKVAIITGGANGIGLGCATRFAEEGAKLALVDLEAETLQDAAKELEALGAEVYVEAADCTDPEASARFVANAEAHFGRLDILINNVGQGARERKSTFLESAEEVWRFVIDLNLFTTMRFSQLVARRLVAQGQGGRIINMSSESALIGPVMSHDYSAAKSAIIGFTRCVARELAPHGITVNAMLPGVIRTRGLERSRGPHVQEALKTILLPFVGEPRDVGALAAYLASEDGRYMTGQSVMAAGGRWFS